MGAPSTGACTDRSLTSHISHYMAQTDTSLHSSTRILTTLSDLPRQSPSKSRHKCDIVLVRRGLACFSVWLTTGMFWFHWVDHFTWWEAFYYTVQAGFSVGFGVLYEISDTSKLFTIFLTLCGSSLIVLWIALVIQSSFDSMNAYRRSVEAWFKSASKGRNSHLTFNEFHAYLLVKNYDISLERAKSLFGTIDVYGKGWITIQQWTRYYDRRGCCYKSCSFFDQWWKLIIFLLWTNVGASYGIIYEKWTIINSFYYTVTACTTGGLQAPSHTPIGMVFTGVLCVIGIPLYALALTDIASWMIGNLLRTHAQEAVRWDDCILTDEFDQEPVDLEWVFFLEKELERVDKVQLIDIRNKFRNRKSTTCFRKDSLLVKSKSCHNIQDYAHGE